MTSLTLFEDFGVNDLTPLVHWRTVFELQVGRKTQLDRIANALARSVSAVWVRESMTRVARRRWGVPVNEPLDGATLLVNGRYLPQGKIDFNAGPRIGTIEGDQIAFIVCDEALARRLKPADFLQKKFLEAALAGVPRIAAAGRLIRYPWDIIATLSDLLQADWKASDAAVESKLDGRVMLTQPASIHVGKGAAIHPTAIVDASAGPIFLDDEVLVGAYAVLEGPLYLGRECKINPHAWLHGGNAIGPVCRLGGEIAGCVIHGFSNKQHDGFLGHSLLGSWVNIGAGAVNSNLKNNYQTVKVTAGGAEIDTGQMFLGAIIADHAKIGINAGLPTGAVIGFAASIAGTGPIPRFVPSFGWVTDGVLRQADLKKSLQTAKAMMNRRQVQMSDEEAALFPEIYKKDLR